MFKHFFNFEVRFWLRGWMVWVFFLIVGAAVFRSGQLRPDHRGQYAGQHLQQCSLGNRELLRGLLACLRC